MGVSDLTVPKRMQAFGEAFYGRTAAYDVALTAGREPLAQALCQEYPERRAASKRRGGLRPMPRQRSLRSAELDEAALRERFVALSLAGGLECAMSKTA